MSQTNTEIVVEVPVVQKIKISRKKKNIVVETPAVEEPPVVELNDFIEDENEEEDIDVKIQLTEEQLKELHKEKNRKIARENIVALRTTAEEKTEAKRQAILTKIQALQEEQLALQGVVMSIRNGENDEELIELYTQENTKTKKEKKQPTYEGKGNKAGSGKERANIIKRLQDGKLIPTNTKKVGDTEWGIVKGELPVCRTGGEDSVSGVGVWKLPTFDEIRNHHKLKLKNKKEYKEWLGVDDSDNDSEN